LDEENLHTRHRAPQNRPRSARPLTPDRHRPLAGRTSTTRSILSRPAGSCRPEPSSGARNTDVRQHAQVRAKRASRGLRVLIGSGTVRRRRSTEHRVQEVRCGCGGQREAVGHRRFAALPASCCRNFDRECVADRLSGRKIPVREWTRNALVALLALVPLRPLASRSGATRFAVSLGRQLSLAGSMSRS
jgi:hypothetical protein